MKSEIDNAYRKDKENDTHHENDIGALRQGVMTSQYLTLIQFRLAFAASHMAKAEENIALLEWALANPHESPIAMGEVLDMLDSCERMAALGKNLRDAILKHLNTLMLYPG